MAARKSAVAAFVGAATAATGDGTPVVVRCQQNESASETHEMHLYSAPDKQPATTGNDRV